MKRWRSALELLEIALLIGVPLTLLAWWHAAPENGFVYDDAYISYRYSVNLANGHGLVWNVGGEPTQGYTNFLFVILVAVGVKLGLPALTAAHALNALGVALVGLAFYAMARQFFDRPLLRILPGLAAATAPLTLVNAITGMETLFWCGLVFSAAALALAYLRAGAPRLLAAHAIVAFLACLTRPETVLFAALWFGILFALAAGHRRAALLAGVGFGAAGAAYLLWLQSYFGAALPNSFYVKVADAGLLPGRGYIEDFLRDQIAPLIALLLPLVGLALLPRFGAWRMVIGLLALVGVVFSLLAFYLLSYPFMGLYYRFVYPVAAALLALSGMGLVAALETALAPDPFRRAGVRGILLAGLCWLLVAPVAGIVASSAAQPMSAGALFYANRRMGEAIARLPAAPQITIAYNDVGILPFVSGARNLDTVGLNENNIARFGKERGWLWVVGYVLGSRPDVIGFYTFPDGVVYNFGHGVIGGYYSVLASAQDFLSNYTYAGGFDADWVHIQWYVRNDSPYRDAIWQVVQEAADFKSYTVRMP